MNARSQKWGLAIAYTDITSFCTVAITHYELQQFTKNTTDIISSNNLQSTLQTLSNPTIYKEHYGHPKDNQIKLLGM